MTDSLPTLAVAGLAAMAWLLVILLIDRYRQLRQPRVVSCATTGSPAAIEVTFDRTLSPPRLRVLRCSHRAESTECNARCLPASFGGDSVLPGKTRS